ncbi:hypothetical protein BDB00DRAFT_795174 [Zychaea mexicana]|uniref:uncharacterized protein n=1 Tax=Zychaea mexicana TaxID=64656 RepID=UPI0022FE6AF9|nr:uncharacterized protein BDB00DRAFT_795174 [Zychaea mexicana]KAI9499703.1 hypothetical protein BDB00DRAFT_795174 [Zychaea mexicana]
MDRVVDMLVNSFPRLEVLHIALCNEHDFEAGFIRLYKNYANLAAAATSATSEVRENAAQTQRRQSGLLKRVFLEGCLSITDRVLSTIGDISTLTTLILYGPFPAVSSDGIKQLVRKLVNLKEITIGILATVKDDTLIGAFDNRTTPYLEIVRLQDLKSVTDYGIIIATDNIAKSLKTLTLTRCRSVTQSAVNFAKRKCTVYDYR